MSIANKHFFSVVEKQRAKIVQWQLYTKPGYIAIVGGLRLTLDYDLSDVPKYTESSQMGTNGNETSGSFNCSKFTILVTTEEGDDPEPGSGPQTGEISIGLCGSSFVFAVPYAFAKGIQELGRS